MSDQDFSYRDALVDGPAHRRGAGLNPGNRFETVQLHVLGEEIARQCLEVLAGCGQPVSTMTKSALVLRDTDLWVKLAGMNAGRVTITLVTLDADLAQKLEPRASSPMGRLRAIRELTAAGVPVTENVAPVIPGLTDVELPRILEAVAE